MCEVLVVEFQCHVPMFPCLSILVRNVCMFVLPNQVICICACFKEHALLHTLCFACLLGDQTLTMSDRQSRLVSWYLERQVNSQILTDIPLLSSLIFSIIKYVLEYNLCLFQAPFSQITCIYIYICG